MAVIAVHSAKGGVGKTTLSVGLSYAAATASRRRTLLWDLDAQGAASHVLARGHARTTSREVLERQVPAEDAIVRTEVEGLSLLPADPSIAGLDAVFAAIDKRKRLRRVLEEVARDYDHVVLDCPPGSGDTAEQIVRAADLILVPVIPSTLSRRAYETVVRQVAEDGGKKGRVLPVFSMVDRRRSAHRAALEEHPDWPVIPMASVAEQMADRRAPIGAYAPKSAPAQVIGMLWVAIERVLAERR